MDAGDFLNFRLKVFFFLILCIIALFIHGTLLRLRNLAVGIWSDTVAKKVSFQFRQSSLISPFVVIKPVRSKELLLPLNLYLPPVDSKDRSRAI